VQVNGGVQNMNNIKEPWLEFINILNSQAILGLLIGAVITFILTKILDRSKARKEYERKIQ